ncbi:MAG: flavodoxin-dependent (E)-4-hydroxy-3-methylbut-2-enyl-diphosphate synthase [Candidatus Caenarcaniphilales bacterium]|nr:flavodoxin-dependent (E)-4-hydroxy-3-methylbut-2-enyl-diphosphate synthase [Candidatus Caenarcaniphilales bacterium]
MSISYKRRQTHSVKIAENTFVGSDYPILVQSMTNTATHDIAKTVKQIKELYLAGSSVVRITVKDDEGAKAVPEIVNQLRSEGYLVPIVGDFHYNGHILLEKYPKCAEALAKYRINPGNVGYGEKHDYNFGTMINIAKDLDKAIRIGVNWGSLDQDLLSDFMEINAKKPEKEKLSFKKVIYQAMKASALRSADLAMELGLPENKIVISVKMSEVPDLLNIYRDVAKSCKFPLHLGLTEAGTAIKGMISSSAAMGILLSEGIGDTIRMSLTPSADEGANNPLSDRTLEVKACQQLLQALELEYFKPSITSCPGCGRTSSTYFQKLADEINDYIELEMLNWKEKYQGVEKLKIAVMGCIVNGPGESKYADIGISLPGDNESPKAPVFLDGKQYKTLEGDQIALEFKEIINKYIEDKFGLAFIKNKEN